MTTTRASGATRTRLRREDVVAQAMAILDNEGVDALTTTRVTQALGVSQPALYSHVPSLTALKELIAKRGAEELSGRVRLAVDALPPGSDRDSALMAMARAYRRYVKEYPNRYLLQLSAMRTEEYLEATERSAEAVREVLRRYGSDEADVRNAHTAFRAAVHGFVHLEAHDALSADARAADGQFDFFIRLFAAGLATAGTGRTVVKGRRRR